MKLHHFTFTLVASLLLACNSTAPKTQTEKHSYPDTKVVSAMKEVMWKGKLGSQIDLDSISNTKGLYGIGPLSYLKGELLINNGKSYVSKVTSDSTMQVVQTYAASAPFFVYTHVNEWNEVALPEEIKNIQDVEQFLQRETVDLKRPFAFKLVGNVTSAKIHIQNLPKGSKVSSPEEAHRGQTNYAIQNEEVEIIGFFSTEHQGIFTHHDSFVHLHLITKDESQMGHLDELQIKDMKLYLPKK
ncbi:acetolactate decarboxylase [Psychroflexus planctonicus]|nr:acetolactate decarboxylase [Psychroflexus planctonicus]